MKNNIINNKNSKLKYKIKIIDKFLYKKDLIELTKYAKNLNNSNEFDVYHNEIDINNNVLKASIKEKLLISLNKNYFYKALNILKKLSPKKIELIKYTDFTIIKTNKYSKFPIHDDTPNKLLSGVIYLYPKKNIGTIFYSSKSGKNKIEINWKLNRAVFFSRKERQTWHSYQGNGVHNRIALVFNLMTDDSGIKKVCEIENKNYFCSMLRYKLNPYVFRFFKKII